MGRNRDGPNPKRKLRIGMAGNVGGGSAAINVLVETTEGIVGGRAMAGESAALSERGVPTELPMPKYGYVRISMALFGERDGDMINDWGGIRAT